MLRHGTTVITILSRKKLVILSANGEKLTWKSLELREKQYVQDNSSLSLGHVPKAFKLTVIKPLIKKPKLDPCELANYRPISNLLFMSKIIENVVSAQLCSFLLKNDIYEEFQSGFLAPP